MAARQESESFTRNTTKQHSAGRRDVDDGMRRVGSSKSVPGEKPMSSIRTVARINRIFKGRLKLDDVVSPEQLLQMEKMFKSHPKQHLTKDEFVDAFGSITGCTAEELGMWFMKVDANASGTLDWEELSSHILSLHRGTLENTRSKEYIPHCTPGTRRSANHKQQITRIVPHERTATYWASTLAGSVDIWSANTLQKVHTLPASKSSTVVTDLCFNSSGTSCYVALMDRVIDVYDTRFNRIRSFVGCTRGELPPPQSTHPGSYNFGRTHRGTTPGDAEAVKVVSALDRTALQQLDASPTAVETVPGDREQDHLLVGLINGQLLAYSPGRVTERSIAPTARMTPHEGLVSKIKYIRSFSGCITSSWDKSLRLIDLQHNESVCTMDGPEGHKRAVCNFDWNPDMKMIAAAGTERVIYFWNPYIKNPLLKLHGHLAPLVSVAFNLADSQLISMSIDKCIKVWDVRTCKLFQSFLDEGDRESEQHYSAVAFDNRLQRIVAGCTFPKVWSIRRSIPNLPPDYVGHTDPLIACMVSTPFQQVVTVDSGACVQVWSLHTGERELVFSGAGQEKGTIATATVATLDAFERRVIIGDSLGHARVFNISNGQELFEMVAPPPEARTQTTVVGSPKVERVSRPPIAHDVDLLQITRILHVARDKVAGFGGVIGPSYRLFALIAHDWIFLYRDGESDPHASLYCRFGTVSAATAIQPRAPGKPPLLVVGTHDGTVVLYDLTAKHELGGLGRDALATRSPTAPRTPFITEAVEEGEEEEEEGVGFSDDDDDEDAGEDDDASTLRSLIGEGMVPKRKSFEDVCWLERQEVLLTVSGSSRVDILCPKSSTLLLSYRLPCDAADGLHSLTYDFNNTVIVANRKGIVFVLDISQLPPATGTFSRRKVALQRYFRLHNGPVHRMQAVEVAGLEVRGVILSCGSDLNVRLHSYNGDWIGTFGQPVVRDLPPWALSTRSTWKVPAEANDVHEPPYSEGMRGNRTPKRKRPCSHPPPVNAPSQQQASRKPTLVTPDTVTLPLVGSHAAVEGGVDSDDDALPPTKVPFASKPKARVSPNVFHPSHDACRFRINIAGKRKRLMRMTKGSSPFSPSHQPSPKEPSVDLPPLVDKRPSLTASVPCEEDAPSPTSTVPPVPPTDDPLATTPPAPGPPSEGCPESTPLETTCTSTQHLDSCPPACLAQPKRSVCEGMFVETSSKRQGAPAVLKAVQRQKAVNPKEWVDRAVALLPLQGRPGFHKIPPPSTKWSPTLQRIADRKRRRTKRPAAAL